MNSIRVITYENDGIVLWEYDGDLYDELDAAKENGAATRIGELDEILSGRAALEWFVIESMTRSMPAVLRAMNYRGGTPQETIQAIIAEHKKLFEQQAESQP